MTTHIPNLKQTRVHFASFCMYLDAEATASAIRLGLPIEMDFNAVEGESEYRIGLQVNGSDKDGEVHVHVNLGRLELIDQPSLPPIKGTIEQWHHALEGLHGFSGKMNLTGAYEVPLDELPPDGLVNGIGGISTQFGKSRLSLTGAEVSIKGGPYRRVTWSKGKKWIRGEIAAAERVVISSNYLVDGLRMLDDGVCQFILEKNSNQEIEAHEHGD
jgi:hypothetical protein